MPKRVAIILGNYKDYAQKYLSDLLASLRAQDYPGEMKIFIYDNATSTESFNYLAKNAPEAELILNRDNDGFAKGNNDAMRLALAQGFDYIVLFNLDMVIEENCVSEMVKVVENTPRPSGTPLNRGGTHPAPAVAGAPLSRGDFNEVGAVQARIMLWPEKELVNSLGNVTHFLGFGYSEGYKENYPSLRAQRSNPEPVSIIPGLPRRRFAPPRNDNDICYPSGAAVLYKAEVLKQVRLFDEEFWMYNEDQDLGWRIWLAGYRCVLAPRAVVYHKYEFKRSASKFYWLDRNRILAIWKNYHWATLLLILPAFVIMELGLILFSLKSGWFKEKLKVWGYFLNPVHQPYLIRARRTVQSSRQIKDRDIIKLFSGKIWYQEIDDIKLRLINPIFNGYWQIIKFIVRW